MDTIKTTDIVKMKNNKKIVMITAYDALFAKIFDNEVDIILVGDSLNMSFKGEKDTLNVSVNEMIYHTKAVKNGVKKALVIADMPFGSVYNVKKALKNAIKIYKESGVDAIKIEGGMEVAPIIKELTLQGIAVCAHIGLRPQQVRFEGGYKIKGRDENENINLIKEAKALEEAGAFCIVIEGVVSKVAKEISQNLKIPTIGIGSGKNVDGQVLVWSDMLGFFEEFKPKFVKKYLDGAKLIRQSVKEYANEVRNETFPSQEFEYEN